MAESIAVIHEPEQKRFTADSDGHVSVCEYELVGEKMVFTHTYTPPEARGQGVADQLVRAALEEARRQGRTVVPACSYVALFIERHKEFQDLVT